MNAEAERLLFDWLFKRMQPSACTRTFDFMSLCRAQAGVHVRHRWDVQ